MLLENLTLIVPTKNDHQRIKSNINDIIKYLEKNIKNFEIILVSNGSDENSLQEIEKLIKKFKNIKHITSDISGKGLAVRLGIINSKYSNILFTDADCSVKITEFNKFIYENRLISGFVVGNRRNFKSSNINSPISRKISGAIYIFLVNLLFNLKIQDSQCGFKAIDKNIFTNSENFKNNGFSFDLELFLLAKKDKIEVTEVPVVYTHDKNSKILIIKDSFHMFLDIFKLYKYY